MLRLYHKRTPPLGNTEREALEVLWAGGPKSALGVHALLRRRRSITVNTVQSTVERLVRKGLLSRAKRGRAYVYTPTLSRRDLLVRMVSELINELSEDAAPAGAGLIDLSHGIDEKTLDRLEQWVDAARRRRGETHR